MNPVFAYSSWASSSKHKTPKTQRPDEIDDHPRQSGAEPTTSYLRHEVDIAQPTRCHTIGDHTRVPGLRTVRAIQAKVDGGISRPLHNLKGPPHCPEGICRQPLMDPDEIEPGTISVYDEVIAQVHS